MLLLKIRNSEFSFEPQHCAFGDQFFWMKLQESCGLAVISERGQHLHIVFIEVGKPTQPPYSSEKGTGDKWQQGHKAAELTQTKAWRKTTKLLQLLCSYAQPNSCSELCTR